MITKYEESFSNTYVLKFRTLKVKWWVLETYQ